MAKAARYYAYKFKVQGTGPFPLDMLRYDNCVVKVTADLFNRPPGENRTVEVTMFKLDKNAKPTFGRWSSFDWIVDPASIEEVKE